MTESENIHDASEGMSLRQRMFEQIEQHSATISVIDPCAGVDDMVTFVVVGRDAPTEGTNRGEPMAAITFDPAEAGYTVQSGEGTERGYDVTHVEETGLSLSDAVDLAATELQD